MGMILRVSALVQMQYEIFNLLRIACEVSNAEVNMKTKQLALVILFVL